MNAKRAKQRGFTLIEILVVIAIIAILAAILFPVFARARESARRASCMSNLKQIGLAVMMYTQDYDEYYPPGISKPGVPPPAAAGGTWITDQWLWQQNLYPYTKSLQVFLCPSSQSDVHRIANYGANWMLIRDLRGRAPIPLAAVTNSSETYMIMDAGNYRMTPDFVVDTVSGWGWLPGSGSLGATGYYQTNPPANTSDWMTGRHFDGVNVTFADGHVKWLKSSVVFQEAKNCVGCNYNDPSTANSAWNPQAP